MGGPDQSPARLARIVAAVNALHPDLVLLAGDYKGEPKLPGFAYSRPVNEAINADLARFDLNPELAKLRMPALVLTGRFDANVAPSTAWKIHHAIPGSATGPHIHVGLPSHRIAPR